MPDLDFIVAGTQSDPPYFRFMVTRNVGPNPKVPAYYVTYNAGYDNFFCAGHAVAPGAELRICEHILTVVRYVTTRTGAWEKNKGLMERAWDLVRSQSKPQVTRGRKIDRGDNLSEEWFSVVSGWGAEAGSFPIIKRGGAYECLVCRDVSYSADQGCDHVEAVRAFEYDERLKKRTEISVKATGSIKGLVEAQKKLGEIMNDQMTEALLKSLADIATVKLDEPTYSTYVDPKAKDVDEQIKDLKRARDEIKRKAEEDDFRPVAKRPDDDRLIIYDELSTKEPGIWKAMYASKWRDVIVGGIDMAAKSDDELPEEPPGETDPPEEPKKPRNRFSEIDL